MEAESSFEANLKELEKTVKSLEGGELGLDVALQQYESGVRLLATCHKMLDEAGKKVAILTGASETGEPQTAEFDATATTEISTGPSKKRQAKSSPDELDTLPF